MELMMPKFDSPIGSKSFPNQPMREFSVSDESGQAPPGRHRDQRAPVIDGRVMQDFQDRMQGATQAPPMREMSDVEREIMAAKKAQREGKERLSDGAKRRIEILIGMTRLTKDVEIDGQHYGLQTLKSRELRDALVATVEFDGSIQLVFETRKQLLARSITMIAGVEISQFLNSPDLESRLDFIEDMDHALLLRLYNEYVSLAAEAQEKYALKTPAEVKEVVEDLKK
jgi:hypothetical protein